MYKIGDKIQIINDVYEELIGEISSFNEKVLQISNAYFKKTNRIISNFNIALNCIDKYKVISNTSDVRESTRKNSFNDSDSDKNLERSLIIKDDLTRDSILQNFNSLNISQMNKREDELDHIPRIGYDYSTSEMMLNAINVEAKVITLCFFRNTTCSHTAISGLAICSDNNKNAYFFDLLTIADLENENKSNYGKNFFKMFNEHLSSKKKIMFESYDQIRQLLLNQYDVKLINTIEIKASLCLLNSNNLTYDQLLTNYLPHVSLNKYSTIMNSIDWIERPLTKIHLYFINRFTIYLMDIRNEINNEIERLLTDRNDSLNASFNSNLNITSNLTTQSEKYAKLKELIQQIPKSGYSSSSVSAERFKKIEYNEIKNQKSNIDIKPAGYAGYTSKTYKFKRKQFF